MKPIRCCLVTLVLLAILSRAVLAQPPRHFISGLTVMPDKGVVLNLDGNVSNMFNFSGTIAAQIEQGFDLYIVEASSNLINWVWLDSILRTNNDFHPLLYRDTNAAVMDKSFYRARTNLLLTFFPRPQGPFPVGTVDRVMLDPARTNLYRYTPPTNTFMVSFWYPSEGPKAGSLPSPPWDDRIASDINLWLAFGLDSRWSQVIPKTIGHHFLGAALAPGTNKYPVILYSHGEPVFRKGASQEAEELASQGYIVAAVDHTDCWATEFPDGRYLYGNSSGDVAGRLQDLRLLLDELARMNSSDPSFAGRLDLDHIGVMGASFGGMVVETCRNDSRVKCAVIWDGTNVQLNAAGLQKPFLAALGQTNSFYAEDMWLFNHATNNAVFVQIKAANHYTCFDSAWWLQVPWARRPSLAINACVVWFFNKYLKGENLPFPTNPGIYNVQIK